MLAAKSDLFESYLRVHKTKPGESPTHTRITGGSYVIEDHELADFFALYQKEIVDTGRVDSLTEKQREGGPLLVDLDFRFNQESRQYNEKHVDAFLQGLVLTLRSAYESDGPVPVYVLEKPEPVMDGDIIKDGIHFVVGLKSSTELQKYVREKMLEPAGLPTYFADLPVTNSWEAVMDESIARGSTNWQLYGSSKPGKKPYKVTAIYEWNQDKIEKKPFENVSLMALSARNLGNRDCTPTLSFCRYMAEKKETTTCAKPKSALCQPTTTDEIQEMRDKLVPSFDKIIGVTSLEEWRVVLSEWLENTTTENKSVYDYVMILPPQYYELGKGTRDRWISTCWAMRNTGYDMLVGWIDFSSQARGFSWRTGIPDLIREWEISFGSNRGLTKRSIMYWCKQDNPSEYAELKKRDIDPYIEQCAMNPTHEDLARILHKLYRHDFVCTKGNVWYENVGHRWILSDNGYGLRKMIVALRNIYREKVTKISDLIRQIANGIQPQIITETVATVANNIRDNAANLPVAIPTVPLQNGVQQTSDARTEQLLTMKKKLTEMCNKLGDTNMKDNIMKEARELFYDSDFVGKLDEKTGLLCFNNGVVDFEAGVFRRGEPEDFISMSTNIDYIPMKASRCHTEVKDVYSHAKHGEIIADIHEFISKIYPDAELREYMWQHLASALTGNENQFFFTYIGNGSNGKSVLTKLMADILGDYKRDVPLTLITEKRQKVGGVAPEIAELKGVRYAVMQESSKGDVVNEGVLKQLTSGTDTVQGRNLYSTSVTRFVPQFKLVMCTNELLDIKSMDGGTWRRMRVINHVSRFVDNPDPNPEKHEYKKLTEVEIKKKMTPLWKQLFMSLLVEKAFETLGVVKDCPMVLAASNAYKARQDLIGTFVTEELVEEMGAAVKKDELLVHYKQWWERTQNGKVSKKDELWSYLDTRYGKYIRGRGWIGVRIAYSEDSGTGSE